MLAPEQASPALLRLVYDLEQALLPFGLEDAPQEFRPHLTLARDYRAPVPESATPPEFFLRAERFTLFESHKGRYRALAAMAVGRCLSQNKKGARGRQTSP